MTIILNPEEAIRLDYETNWKDLVNFESYLDILAQRRTYNQIAKGLEIESIKSLKP